MLQQHWTRSDVGALGIRFAFRVPQVWYENGYDGVPHRMDRTSVSNTSPYHRGWQWIPREVLQAHHATARAVRAHGPEVHAELRQANWQHRPEPQPALLCDWGLYLGGLAEAWRSNRG